MDYDVIIIGAGPGGIYAAYELTKEDRGLQVAVFEVFSFNISNGNLVAD